MFKEFTEFCKSEYPYFQSVFEKEAVSPNLFSFKTADVESSAYEKIENLVKAVYTLRNNLEYQTDILGTPTQHPHKSVLMSFDFHLVKGQPKLIEINTNASHYLISYLMDRFLCKKENREPSFTEALDQLESSFRTEWNLFSNRVLKTICIVDDKPEEQKAYFEFLLYEAWLRSKGFETSIEDFRNLTYSDGKLRAPDETEIDFVYNRTTDFYFDLPESVHLKKAYDEKSACISPQPQEYQLLADKKRLFDFSTPGFLEKYLSAENAAHIKELLLAVIEVTEDQKDGIWDTRKKYFFKPKTSFGGKGVYKGESISRKAFANLLSDGNYLAQEIAPPSTIEITDEFGKEIPAKCDFRFFVYDGQIHFATARAYTGQTTNFRNRGGGFASVNLKNSSK